MFILLGTNLGAENKNRSKKPTQARSLLFKAYTIVGEGGKRKQNQEPKVINVMIFLNNFKKINQKLLRLDDQGQPF